MAGIHDLLKQSAQAIGCRYILATLDEANSTIFDQLKVGSFPVCLVLHFDITDTRDSGKVSSKAEVNAFFLTRTVSQATIDKPSADIEGQLVSPMRALARTFVNIVDKSDLMNEEGITDVVYRSVYEAMMDAHVYGCQAVFTPNFSEDLTTCGPQDTNEC